MRARRDRELRRRASSRRASSSRPGRTARRGSTLSLDAPPELPLVAGGPGEDPPGARQPGRQRDQVLTRRRARRDRALRRPVEPALRRPRRGPRRPPRRAAAHLREVLPPRPEHDPRRRRHRASACTSAASSSTACRGGSGSSPRARAARARPSRSSCRWLTRVGPGTRTVPGTGLGAASFEYGPGPRRRTCAGARSSRAPPTTTRRSSRAARRRDRRSSRIDADRRARSRPLRRDVHRPDEDGADCDQDQADSESHVTPPFHG